jgi:hypothetical protein
MVDFRDEWQRLSAQYIKARERYENASAVVSQCREGFLTCTEDQLNEEAAARAELVTARHALYRFVGRVDPE